jgi:hypothetical protein
MVHRDPLTAAHERIAALERALTDRAGGAPGSPAELEALRDANRELERARMELEEALADERRKKSELRKELDKREAARERTGGEVQGLRRTIEALRAELEEERARTRAAVDRLAKGGSAAPSAPATPAAARRPTLAAHNAAFPPLAPGEGAGVSCTACAAAGLDAELARQPVTIGIGNATFQSVACLRCGAAGLLRVR